MSKPTTLRDVRLSEGLTRAALARLAGVSEKTIMRAESGMPVAEVTRYKIVNALNRQPGQVGAYAVEDLFGV